MASILGGLTLSARRPGRLVLTLPAAHRVVFGVLSVLSAFILCFGVLFEGEPTVLAGRNAVAGLLTLTMVFGLVYEDRWTFDRTAGRVENRFGTLFFARRTRFPMADLERIGIERFTRGRLVEESATPPRAAPSGGSGVAEGLRQRRRAGRQSIVRLLAVDRGGEVHVLDVGPAHRLAQFRGQGLRIAEFCGVSFEDGTGGAAPTA
jgi:hypothetical protein